MKPNLSQHKDSKKYSEVRTQSGLWEERRAFQYLREHFQIRLLKHRYRSPFGEVDLVLERPNGRHLLIEVKSLSDFEFAATRISSSQRQRLTRIYTWYLETHPETEFWLLMVQHDGKILRFEDFLS